MKCRRPPSRFITLLVRISTPSRRTRDGSRRTGCSPARPRRSACRPERSSRPEIVTLVGEELMRRPGTLLALTALLASAAPAQSVVPAVRAWREQHETQIVRELTELVAIPNVASDAVNIRRNAEFVRAMLERHGVAARILENGPYPPAVYGALAAPRATRTIVFYAHYDGQPVTPAEWMTPPWQPTARAT